MDLEAMRYLAAAITVAIGVIGSALGEGNIGGKAMEAMGRNPSAGKELFPRMIVGMVIAESPAIFALVIALIILFI